MRLDSQLFREVIAQQQTVSLRVDEASSYTELGVASLPLREAKVQVGGDICPIWISIL